MSQSLCYVLKGKLAGRQEPRGVGVPEGVEGMAAEVCLAVLFKGPDIVSSHLAPILSCADVGGRGVV